MVCGEIEWKKISAEMMLRYGITIRTVMTIMCLVHTSMLLDKPDQRCMCGNVVEQSLPGRVEPKIIMVCA